jgi:hypothetical protein
MLSSYSFLTSGGSRDVPQGLVTVVKMNSRSRFFLTSTENYFAGHKVEVVMIDSGCNTILLPIKDGELESFKTKFDPDEFTWELTSSKGVSHRSISLCISPNNGAIPLELCKDLINNPNPAVVLASEAGVSHSFLRFHLCTEDMERLMLPDMANILPENTPTILSNYLKNNKTPIQRKKYALLGQVLLNKFACIQLFGFRQYSTLLHINHSMVGETWNDYVHTWTQIQTCCLQNSMIWRMKTTLMMLWMMKSSAML